MAQVTQLPLVLTPDQVGYLFDQVENEGAEQQVIYACIPVPGTKTFEILVGRRPYEEGDGVWVDTQGQEHQPNG